MFNWFREPKESGDAAQIKHLQDLLFSANSRLDLYQKLWLTADREVRHLNRSMARRNRRIKRQMAALKYYRDKERTASGQGANEA